MKFYDLDIFILGLWAAFLITCRSLTAWARARALEAAKRRGLAMKAQP